MFSFRWPWAKPEPEPQLDKKLVNQLRAKLGNITAELTDDEVLKLAAERERLESEPPFLDVKHSGIDKDGRIRLEMDWNQAFIRHLREHNIHGETDEQAIQKYLMLLTRENAEDEVEMQNEAAAFGDLNRELDAELQQATKIATDRRGRARQSLKRR